MIPAAAAALQLPPTATRRRTCFFLAPPPSTTLLRYRNLNPSKRLLVVSSSQSNFSKAVQTAWRVGKDAVDAGSSLVPGSVPRPVARIGVTFVAVSVALFLLKSVISTALFVLAMMGLIYFGFLVMNPKEGSRVNEGDTNPSDDPAEEARRIMEKYK